MFYKGKPLRSFRQADIEWSTELLGNSRTSTVGAKGCAVACVAMATQLRGAGGLLTPRQVNIAGRAAGGFVSGSGSMILERLAKSASLVAPESLRLRDKDPSVEADQKVLASTIFRSLSKASAGGFFVDGGFCILNVDHNGDEHPDHFILLVGPSGDHGWEALDPAPGASIRIDSLTFQGDSLWGHSPGGTEIWKHYKVIGAAPIGVELSGDFR